MFKSHVVFQFIQEFCNEFYIDEILFTHNIVTEHSFALK